MLLALFALLLPFTAFAQDEMEDEEYVEDEMVEEEAAEEEPAVDEEYFDEGRSRFRR